MNKDAMDEWVLRDELLSAFHRWPVIIAFIFAGFLLGFIVAFLWPPVFQASTDISVELNPYRAMDDRYVSEFAGVEFRNVDDYKHWQMSQLAVLVTSALYLSETQDRLVDIDPYWQSVTLEELREMLQVSWRNAGRWMLSADADTAEHAQQALETWQEVILEKTGHAIESSKKLFELELALRSLNDELVAAQTCLSILEGVSQRLGENVALLRSADPDAQLSQQDRDNLNNLIPTIDKCGTGWQSFRDQFPVEGSLISEYFAWIELVDIAISQELALLGVAVENLAEDISSANSDWEAALQSGQGLSASLVLTKIGENVQQVKQIRSYSLVTLVGGFLGLLTWFLAFLFKITRAAYQ